VNLTPGLWDLQADGGRDVAAFRTSFRFPAPLKLLDSAEFTYGLAQEVHIRWDAAGYDPDDDEVQITIGRQAWGLTCITPAKDGSVMLPVGALLHNMADPVDEPRQTELRAVVSRRPDADIVFRFPLVNGVQSAGMIRYHVSTSRSITLREVKP
jgi:hypothetical protein